MIEPNHPNLNSRGQALVEYILIFSLFALISMGLIKAFSTMMDNTFTSLSFILSQHLSVGVCEQNCFFKGYVNQ